MNLVFGVCYEGNGKPKDLTLVLVLQSIGTRVTVRYTVRVPLKEVGGDGT